MSAAKAPTASGVSAYLRRAGLNPVARGTRDGVSCSGGLLDLVWVSVSVEMPRAESRLATAVDEVLAASKYTVERISDTQWRVAA